MYRIRSKQKKTGSMRKKKELEELIEEMQDEADIMAFEEHAFMKEELEKHPEEPYKFELHQQQYEHTKEKKSMKEQKSLQRQIIWKGRKTI